MSQKLESFTGLQNALQKIIYGEITFVILLMIVLLLAQLIIINNAFEFKQTTGVEAVMTLTTAIILFVIPYFSITYSFFRFFIFGCCIALLIGFLLIITGIKFAQKDFN